MATCDIIEKSPFGSPDHHLRRPSEMIKLTITKSKSDKYYYAQMSVRKGKKVSSETIEIIGKHSELLKITDDPEAYAKERVEQLDHEYQNARAPLNYTVDFSKKIEESDATVSKSTIRNTGYFFLQHIMSKLVLRKYFSQLTADSKIQYDPYTVFRFLTYDRILFPRSKLQTWEHLDNYYEKPDFGYHDILRFMDILANDFDGFISYLFEQSNNLVKRDLSVCYYDCTNFYFEIEKEDEDYIDEVTGEIIHALREYGFSKECAISVTKPGKSGAEEIKAMMENFRANPPKELGGSKVVLAKDFKTLKATDGEGNVTDLVMPETSNVLQYFTEDGSKVSVRPSGTEPKIKFYMEAKGEMGCAKCYESANAAADAKFDGIKKSLGI